MHSLAQYHSFALPTFADSVVAIDAVKQLQNVDWKPTTWILGSGTNTIFTEDYAGTILVNQLLGKTVKQSENDWLVEVGAGENWHALVSDLITQGIYGFENLALIPGSVGAAPVQNIGAYGVEVSQFIRSVDIYDLKNHEVRTMTNAECGFGYRDSIFKRSGNAHLFITSVTFSLPRNWQPVLTYPDLATLSKDSSAQAVMEHVIDVRNAKLPDPNTTPNAGSFFKNPVVTRVHYEKLQSKYPNMPAFELDAHHVKLAAGWLIDQAGLKLAHKGDAAVHQRQALVLVNRGKANGNDLLELAKQIIATVREIYDVSLEPEVRLLGRDGLLTKL